MDDDPNQRFDDPSEEQPAAAAQAGQTRVGGNAKGLRWAAAVVVLLVLGAAAAGVVVEQNRLNSTRSTLGAVKAAVGSQAAQLTTLKQSAAGQQQTLASMSAQLTTTAKQLQAAQSQLSAGQSQLQGDLASAQSRLGADEKQLNLTTAQLPPDLTSLAAKVTPSVVLVTCASSFEGDTGTGFAFALPVRAGSTTEIVTAEHVIDLCADPSSGATLTLTIGGQTVPAHIDGADATSDVAILGTAARLPLLQPSSAPVVGEFLMAIGHPLGNVDDNVTTGNVSDVLPSEFLDSAPVSNGNSGGPVVDRDGHVVGVVDAEQGSAADPVRENLNISLRMSRLCAQIVVGPVCSTLH